MPPSADEQPNVKADAPKEMRPDPRISRLAKRLADRYSFLSILGRGGSGTVYEVENLALNRREALKVLAESQVEGFSSRFAQEAKVAASLDHPDIVRIHDFGSTDGIDWYAMQLVDGPTLANILEGGIRMDQVSMARLAVPLLNALDYSHSRGVVHRDIKPANVLISPEGRPYLTDFGIAKTDDSVLKTLTGQMMGTPAYVSPEQALGETVDLRTDLYSLGVTLYQLLAGALPFTAESALQTVVMRLNEAPEPLIERCPTMDAGLADCIMKALARNREDRWASAAEMRAALQRACDAAGIAWNQPLAEMQVLRQLLPAKMRTKPLSDLSTTVQAEIPHSRKFRPTAIALLAAVVLGAAGLIWLRSRTVLSVPEPAATKAPAKDSKTIATVPTTGAESQPSQISPTTSAVPARKPVTIPEADLTPPPDLKGSPDCMGLSVALSVVVGEDGLVRSSRVLSSASPACAKAAQEAVARWHFKPALDAEGKPVETTVSIAIPFVEGPR